MIDRRCYTFETEIVWKMIGVRIRCNHKLYSYRRRNFVCVNCWGNKKYVFCVQHWGSFHSARDDPCSSSGSTSSRMLSPDLEMVRYLVLEVDPPVCSVPFPKNIFASKLIQDDFFGIQLLRV